MRRLKRVMLVIAAGGILHTANHALAQATVSGPTAAPPAPPATSGVSGAESPSAAETKSSAGTAANSGAGYTWRDKPIHGKRRKVRAAKVNPNLAQARGPEFSVVADGTTRITVQLSKKVEFHTEDSRHRLIVNLAHAQVAVLNDRNPLITTHFATPVEDARLVPNKDSVRLVIDLREAVVPQVTIKDAGAGSSLLEVVLPKSYRKPSAATTGSTRAKAKPRSRAKAKAPDQSTTPNNGAGPQL